MNRLINLQNLLLALCINIGLIWTLVYTNAILVSDHERTIIEWCLAIIYFPQTISLAALPNPIGGVNRPDQFALLIMAFIFSLPASLLYSSLLLNFKKCLTN